MKIARCLLAWGVCFFVYAIAVAGASMPGLFGFCLVCICGYAARGVKRRLTTLGSARWAGADDLRRAGMIETGLVNAGSGLILGRFTDNRRHFWQALMTLFNRKIDPLVACRQFLAALAKSGNNMLVKLKAVHVAIFAPTAVGKGVSLVIPLLAKTEMNECRKTCQPFRPFQELLRFQREGLLPDMASRRPS